MSNRKGARSFSDIDADILDQLNSGEAESFTLSEWLAVDYSKLAGFVLPDILGETAATAISEKLALSKETGIIKRLNTAARLIRQEILHSEFEDSLYDEAIRKLSAHTSDTVRCWAALIHCGKHHSAKKKEHLEAKQQHDKVVKGERSREMKERFGRAALFAKDPHFGVREIAWMAVRDLIIEDPETSIQLLLRFAADPNENMRRFACELTRPRGVWCAHSKKLKTNPETALPLLEMLKTDESDYVQNSVGNWLNDASKTAPDFTTEVCERWLSETKETEGARATAYICKRAMRSIRKKG
ncbi:MAG: DNA alkylation repair protein [Balneolales bacterium]|nr:DNA alkylation repair protein [Balneolales bacterium]